MTRTRYWTAQALLSVFTWSAIAPAAYGVQYTPKFFVPKREAQTPTIKTTTPAVPAAKSASKPALAAQPASAKATSTTADLAENEEIAFTPAIRALADTLGRNPVRIHYWVRNNIEFVPTYGSMQGAQGTLDAKRGNAWDIASLTIALLRASGVPARYAKGTIELPAAVANSWVGGSTSAAATAALLAQGGIPSSTVLTSNQITAIRLEHVWVEVFVDFIPSRGQVSRTPASWVPVDPSFKQVNATAGLNGASLGGFNAANLATLARQGATIDADGAVRVNSAGLASSYQSFTTQAQTGIAGTRPNATVGDVLGTRAIVGEDFPYFMGTLPYKTVTAGASFSEVPEKSRWKVRYGVFATELDRAQGRPLATIERSVAALIGHKVTLAFAPTTASEKQVLDGLLLANPFPTSLPGYQVRMKAQLRLDGAMAQEGGDALMGTRFVGGAEWRDPSSPVDAATQLPAWTPTPSHDVVVGETHAIAVTVNGVPTSVLSASRDRAAAIKAKLAAGDFAGVGQDDTTGELLNFAALAYAGAVEGNARVLRDAAGVLGSSLPSIFRASTVAGVTYADSGAPQAVTFPGMALDTLVLPVTAVAKDGKASRAVGLQRLLGARASAYAHLVAQQLFTDAAHAGEATSGAKALSRANDAGIKLYTATSANIATVKPLLHIDDATKNLVDDAARSGSRAAVTGDPVAVSGWSGAGYAIDDPDSGTTEYEISKRYAGAVYPSGGLGVLALAGHAIAAGVGATVSTNLSNALAAAADMTTSLAVLNADYRSVAWSSWAGAPSVLSAWWLAAIDDGAAPLLGAQVATIVDGLVAGQVTTLTGAPQPNNPPKINSQPVTTASTGLAYQYLVAASDPDGDPLTYSLTSAPAGMSISSSGLVSWAAPTLGSFQVTVRVSDGKVSVDQSFVVNVGEATSLTLSLAVTPQFVNTGDVVTITVAAVGGRGPVTRTLKVDGVVQQLDANGQYRVSAAGLGGHDVVATANDGFDNLTQASFFAIGDPADTADPVATLTSPENDSEITAPTNIVGTANDARLAEWRLSVSPHNLGRFTLIARGTTPVLNATLGKFDPTTLANGLYDVLLEVVDASGRRKQDSMTYEVTEQLKLGQFTVSFLDVSVEAAGIPVQVTRTYDTRRKIESLDFGYGWTVDYQNMKLQKNVSTGLGWVVVSQGVENCIKATGKRKVNVTLPDGRVERFEASLTPECALVNLPQFQVVFNPVGKTTSTLEIPAGFTPVLTAQGGNLVDTQTALPWNPTRFRLTTLERFVYDLDENFGILKVTEPNGNFLTYSASGVVHSAGSSVTFTRDAQNRITRVTDPNGKVLTYAYDTVGNLASVTDRANAQSVMEYDRLHTLTSYTDPRGTQLVRYEYDSAGRLIAQYDATGAKIDLAARDPAASKEVVKDRRGNTSTYEYDAIGNVTKITDAANGTTEYTYDARGNEATVKDPLGHTTIKTFDGDDNPLTEKDPAGNETTYAWKPRSRDLRSIKDARGNTTLIEYTVIGNLGIITDPLGNSTHLGYGSGGNLTSLTDGAGNESLYEYDTKGRRTKETDPAGGVTTYEYDENGNATKVTKTRTVNGVPQTLVTTRVVDADGNVTTETDPTGGLTRSTYNALKKVETQRDALDRLVRYDYDARGYQTKVTHPDGLAEQKTYDANGNEETATDRAGRVTTNTYDVLDRLTKVTYADGKFVENGYDAAGRLTSVKDERGFTTIHEYDLAGRRTKTTDPEQGVWLYEYDKNGNLTKATDPRLGVTTHEYDLANRRTKTTYPVTPPDTTARFETWEYDGAGRRTAWVDTGGNRMAYTYDGAGRLKTVTQPSPDGTAPTPVTTYGYDELGNKVSQADALNHITRWEYDALGRTTKRTLPGGQFETFVYDPVGNVSQHTTFNGEVVTFTYDTLNRLKTKSLPAAAITGATATTVTYTYTPTGQVDTIEDTRGVTRHTYDERDRLKTVATPEGWTTTYTYDAAGNRTHLATQFTGEAAKTTVHEFDRANRLTKVTSPEGEVTTYTYDAAGNRKTASLPNGTSITWTYDARNRATRVEHKKVSTNSVIAGYDYLWNAQGLRSRETVTSNPLGGCVTDYSYDRLGRLTKATTSSNCSPGDGEWNYTYDAVGNRLVESGRSHFEAFSWTSTYDANDRLQAVARTPNVPQSPFVLVKDATYTYDAAGNVTKKTEPDFFGAEQVTQYFWDAEGRMVGALPRFVSGQPAQPKPISYVYDAEGQLVREVKDAVIGQQPPPDNVTLYLADKNRPFSQILEERGGAGQLKTSYLFGDTLIKQVSAGTTSYVHADHLSTMFLTDTAGNLQTRYAYSPYGEVTAAVQAGSSTPATITTVHQFAGERLNSDLTLYYNRARWMDPRAGRFGSVDPAPGNRQKPISLHDYLYASDDPANRSDPSGRTTLMDVSGSGLSLSTATINLTHFVAATRAGQIAMGGVPIIATQGQQLRTLLAGGGRSAMQAMQTSVYGVARGASFTEQQLRQAWQLGSSYTQTLNGVFGMRASQLGMEYHKLIEGSFGAPSQITYSFANIVPTPQAVHTAISALHSTNIPGRAQTLRSAIQSAYQSGRVTIEQLYTLQARIWAEAMSRNGGKIDPQEVVIWMEWL